MATHQFWPYSQLHLPANIQIEVMGVLATVKKNKVGAVVVSVFDWYRKC
jgi:hypothetical protein